MSDDELPRLHFINTLFAQVTGSDLYLAEQIRAAIAFSLNELEAQTTADPASIAKYDQAFTEEAARLLGKIATRDPDRGFYHWNAARTLESATPLFAREEVMTALKQLARFRDATLLITNLRPALLPATQRATARRVNEYEQTLAFIRELIAARVTPSAHLQVLFL